MCYQTVAKPSSILSTNTTPKNTPPKGMPMSDESDYDDYEEKWDELTAGLRESYAAGYAAAIEDLDVDVDFEATASNLKNTDHIAERHYYYWDGRVKPLELWLQDHYGVDE